MSILSQASSDPSHHAANAILAGTMAAALLAIWVFRVYRPASVRGPVRLRADEQPHPWAFASLLGAVAWLGTQAAYIASVAQRSGEPGGTTVALTPEQMAIAATVPAGLGAVVMLVGLAMAGPGWFRRLGLAGRSFAQAVFAAVACWVVAYPLMYGVGLVLVRIYDYLHYTPPDAHELLLQMQQSASPAARAGLILAAVVIAPVFEELLFRGGLQTTLRWMLNRFANPPEQLTAPAGGDAAASGHGAAVRESSGLIWLAILITSVLFAFIHAPWMAPAIFVLSVCLGYVYERTGNLWACIIAHAMFNGVNTVLFLWLAPGAEPPI